MVLLTMDLRQKVCNNLTIMQNSSSAEGLYINDFHRSSSMAALLEVKHMLLHPYSRQQKLEQIKQLNAISQISKKNSNAQRNRLKS